jgi:hypothetical protein
MTEKRKELHVKYDLLEDKREELIQQLQRYYDRADMTKKKIFEIEVKIKALAKEMKHV